MKPVISIICPVYNSEIYLDKCINSIINQTYKEWELILIDDGSHDNSDKICDRFSSIDNRITTIHKINGGASAARNSGIEIAKGKWIVFVDSDDTVGPNYLRNLIDPLKDDTELVYSNFSGMEYIKENITLHGKGAIAYFVNNGIFSLSGPVAKLFSTEIIRKYNITFPESFMFGEDAIFNLRYLQRVKNKISLVNKCDYFITASENSLSTRYYDFQTEYDTYKVWKDEEYTLFKAYYPDKEALALTWKTRIASQFTRVIQCVYRHRPRYSSLRQYHLLRSIPIEDLSEYAVFYRPEKIRHKITKRLVVNRFFSLYLLLGLLDIFVFKSGKRA